MFRKLVLATALLSSAVNVANAQTVVSWAEVNSTLAGVATKVKAQAPYLSALNLNFDPSSDLNADTLKLNLEAGTEKAIWEGGKATLNTDLSVNAVATADAKRDITGRLGVSLLTKVLPALKHLLGSQISECATSTPSTDEYSAINQNAYCSFMTKLGLANVVSDLRFAAVEAIQDYQTNVGNFITQKEAAIVIEKDADKKAGMEYQVARAKKDLADMGGIKVSGSGDEMLIRYDYTFAADEPVLITFDISAKDEVVGGNISIGTKILETEYQDYKKMLAEYVTAIEQKTPDALEAIEQLATSYAQLVEQFITQ